MKKKIRCLVVIFAFILSVLYIENNVVYASDKVVYNVVETDIVKFKKSKGKLVIKTVKE